MRGCAVELWNEELLEHVQIGVIHSLLKAQILFSLGCHEQLQGGTLTFVAPDPAVMGIYLNINI
jgi:hypothetical protein